MNKWMKPDLRATELRPLIPSYLNRSRDCQEYVTAKKDKQKQCPLARIKKIATVRSPRI